MSEALKKFILQNSAQRFSATVWKDGQQIASGFANFARGSTESLFYTSDDLGSHNPMPQAQLKIRGMDNLPIPVSLGRLCTDSPRHFHLRILELNWEDSTCPPES